MVDDEPPSFTTLPINVRDVLHARGVESTRIEFKRSWDPVTTGVQVIRSLCAFANDLYNINGGYVVLGVDAPSGVAILPPHGLPPDAVESIARELRGQCNRIEPRYYPLFSHEIVDARHLLILWAPASDMRPHQAPKQRDGKDREYYVRINGETVQADATVRQQLLEQTARVPFDDRRSLTASLDHLRESLVRGFLVDVGSGLAELSDVRAIYRSLRVSYRVNGHEVPRNIGLLFFAEDPDAWFRGARIELVQFTDDASGDILEERVFRGPLQEQVRDCIKHLGNLSTQHREKQPGQLERRDWVSFPLDALREAVVNAVYHRSYDGVVEPTKIYVFPDRIEITSYPGPVRGIERRHLADATRPPDVPARNRRIGELLKELRLAEARNTGLLKIRRAMLQNGSPPPTFTFDEDRTYFTVVLPAHPEYVELSALRDAAQLGALGDPSAALARLERAFQAHPGSDTLAVALIEEYLRQGQRLGPPQDIDLARIQAVVDRHERQPASRNGERVQLALVSALLAAGREHKAKGALDRLAKIHLSAEDALQTALFERRLRRPVRADHFFGLAGDLVRNDARALHEFALTKLHLAQRMANSRDPSTRAGANVPLPSAREMLERVLQMDAPTSRHAHAWHDLGVVLQQQGADPSEIHRAFANAARLAPDEPSFQTALRRLTRPPS